MFEINIVKKVLIHIRTSIKIIALFAIAAIMISGLVAFAYKPIYSVTFQGQHIGYSENKSELQKKINEYMETGEGEYKRSTTKSMELLLRQFKSLLEILLRLVLSRKQVLSIILVKTRA